MGLTSYFLHEGIRIRIIIRKFIISKYENIQLRNKECFPAHWLGLGYTQHDVYFIFRSVNDDADSRTCHILLSYCLPRANSDIGERKQHILVTISCVRIPIFSTAISKHETNKNRKIW